MRVAVYNILSSAKKLVAKLDAVHADPKYRAVWTNAEIHGMRYSGPRYDDELESLREVLEISQAIEVQHGSD